MKFTFLKTKKDRLPSLKSLRPPIFNTDMFWFASLGAGLVVFLATAFVGFKFWYFQYFENFKTQISPENYENLININRLQSVIDKRNSFINQEISLPEDPSL